MEGQDQGTRENISILGKALDDGVITVEQYDELVRRANMGTAKREKKDIQKSLIASGVAIIVIVVGFFFIWLFSELGYVGKVSVMILLTAVLFIGSLIAKNEKKWKLHFGLLVGSSFLFVLGYGYAFLNQIVNSGYRDHVTSADRHPLLGLPLIVMPALVMLYLIHKNSRDGSQAGLFSLLIGGMILFSRMDYMDEPFFHLLGVAGAIILVFIIFLNLQWLKGNLQNSRRYYEQRSMTIDSLSSSGYLLGNLYLWLFFVVAWDYTGKTPIYVSALITMLLAFVMIFYGIKYLKKGLFASACGVVLGSSWIIGLAIMEGIGFLVMGVLTGFILIGLSLLVKDVPEFKKGHKGPGTLPQPPSNMSQARSVNRLEDVNGSQPAEIQEPTPVDLSEE